MRAPEYRLGDMENVLLFRGVPTSRTKDSGELPVFSVADLRRAEFPSRFVSRAELESSGAPLSESRDVLVAVEGGTVGECLVVPDEDPEFVPSQQVATLRVLRGGEIDPWYLGAWLSSDQGRQRLMMLTRGSTIKRIAVKDLEKFEVPVPEMAVQKRIGERYRAFSASILAHEEAVSNLKALRMVDLLVAFAVDDPVAAARSGSGDARDRASTVEPASAVPVGESAAIEIEGGKS